MFKKIIVMFLISLCMVSNADARLYGGRHHIRPHGHPPVIVRHSHSDIGGILAAGVIGTVIGSVMASNTQNTISYVPSDRCVVLRSRYDGRIVRRCYKASVCSQNCNDDVYDILYID